VHQRHRHRPHLGRQVGDGQAEREQLAIDDPVAQTGADAESHPLGQRRQPFVDALAVTGLDAGQAVAQHDPVQRLALAGQGAGLARLPDGLGIDARLEQIEAHRVDMAQDVEVDEAVVHRGDDQVGAGMGQPRQGRVAAGRVDDHEVGVLVRAGERLLEARQLLGLAGLRQGHAIIGRMTDQGLGQHGILRRQPGPTVGEEAGHRRLAQVQVHDRHAGPAVQQGRGQVHGDGRLARPALFIAHHDDMRLRRHRSPQFMLPSPVRCGFSADETPAG